MLRRRTLLQGAAVGVTGAVLPAVAAHADPITVSADGITLTANADGSITVNDGAADRITLTHFLFKDSVLGTQRTFGGTPSLITLPDGRPAIKVAYKLPASASALTITGTFDVTGHRAHLRYDVSGSATLTPTGFMIGRTVLNPAAAEAYTALTRWTRDAGGGIPYEINAGGLYAETWSGARGYFRLTATTPAYTNATWLHAPGTATGTSSATTEATLVLGELRPQAAATVADQSALGAEIWTDQSFNLWDAGGQPMAVHAQVVNGGTAARTVTVGFWARDFDGALVASQTVTAELAAGAAWSGDFTVTAPPQGILLTEVTATAGADEALARTTLAVLPPYAYQAGQDSMFGISNYPWLLAPSQADVANLLQRIGVKWIRIAYDGAPGIPVADLDDLGIFHNVQKGGIPIGGTAEAKAAWAAEITALCTAGGARYYEAGNELNQPWMSGLGAAQYAADALIPLRAAMEDAGATFKVMNCGLGGMDYNWLANFEAAGGWPKIDALAIHPGRGNFTPDYAPDPSTWTEGSTGSYWNYLGSLRKAREVIADYDAAAGKTTPTELWLTEAYASTKPNVWWTDTPRHAAENVLLSLALAKAEGVRGVNWYQLHDSTIHHPQAADPANIEFHHGLMNRDTSAKPSLLAYATAARALDQATFDRWVAFDDPDLHGLAFTTPDGPLYVLWSRKDGYILNADHADGTSAYATPETWVDTWQTKTTVRLAATGTHVRQVDCVGRETLLPKTQGRVSVVLDGAPRLYYGLCTNLGEDC
ncbi:hypothetical protein AB0H43_28375 [Hamadaea sp. NPDC050747]|uniref:hypothetical protein n=1 Tax=Hamadaea sp. NPDC050747 TaxID=3155789 RepID=UPI0033D72BAE